MRAFCAERGLSTASLCKWWRAYAKHGEAGLSPRDNPRNRAGRTRRAFSAEERLAAVLAWKKSGLTAEVFAKRWGVSASSVRNWHSKYGLGGGQALQDAPPRRKGPGKGGGKAPQGGKPRLPASTEAAIVAAKKSEPTAGLKRIKQGLWRLLGLRVSTGGVRRVLKDHGLHEPLPSSGGRRGRKPPRRFERARPGQLWQTDITSYVLARPGRRVYLTVFLDDHSRYIVSWRLEAHQRNTLVLEALEEGLQRYGKPTEVLTDQGPQYHTWRGKSAFRKRLEQEGIAQVVARAHHPQTLGKCERLWKTIGEEFWGRARPDELSDARQRLGHWIAHYNFFRTHQGIDGVVPADRFFGAEDELRRTLEAELSDHELRLALERPTRQPVYLFGRIGGRSVSLRGEKGQLVLETDGEPIGTVPLAAMGVSDPEVSEVNGSAIQEQSHDEAGAGRKCSEGESGRQSRRSRSRHQDRRSSGPATEPSAHGDRVDPADADVGAGAVGVGNGGAATTRSPDLHPDPGDVAGEDASSGGGVAAGRDAAAGVAAVGLGDGGYAGGPAETAEEEARHGQGDAAAGAGSGETAQEDRAARERAGCGRGSDHDPAGAAGEPRSGAGSGGPEDGCSGKADSSAKQSGGPRSRPVVGGEKGGAKRRRSGTRSPRGSGRSWLGRWGRSWLRKAGSGTEDGGGSRGGSR